MEALEEAAGEGGGGREEEGENDTERNGNKEGDTDGKGDGENRNNSRAAVSPLPSLQPGKVGPAALDAKAVDGLVEDMERRGALTERVCEGLLGSFGELGVGELGVGEPGVAGLAGPAEAGALETSLETSLSETSLSPSQCSGEVRTFVALMSQYRDLVKAFYSIRSVREGLWTPAMAQQLAEEPGRDREKLERHDKRRADFDEAFDDDLKKDKKENNAGTDLQVREESR